MLVMNGGTSILLSIGDCPTKNWNTTGTESMPTATNLDADLMDNVELPPEEVKTLIEETKSIYNSIKYSYEKESYNFDDIMENVYLHTSQVLHIMLKDKKDG